MAHVARGDRRRAERRRTVTNKVASKGHTYLCGSCALRRTYLGALIEHVRTVHQRRMSAPEYRPVTDLQATTFAQMVHGQQP